MNTPHPPRRLPLQPHTPLNPIEPIDPRLTTWTELQHELSELHARLEYFRLLLNLSARRVAGG